ncbi:uncharacterized protein LOC123566524 [Mercenaria mercenaria]|uniref:uncharacterized protein LOC123566524 n=1 Tax=Mercenaria mercenaria TaxID=6596 RepID=UPI00234E4CBA|nr:uncharacterized protein LOC123566524 [Mercenaria mercenaria]XP_045216639.2 uncharacterized protein LOC123566524 [Mercenaria mercenaria]
MDKLIGNRVHALCGQRLDYIFKHSQSINSAVHKQRNRSINSTVHKQVNKPSALTGNRTFCTMVNISSATAGKRAFYTEIYLPTSGRVSSSVKLTEVSSRPPMSDETSKMSEKFNIRLANSCQCSKTLVIIFGFYGAPEKAIGNYCRLYHGYGFDAMYVPSFLKHFAWPNNSLELATDLLSFVNRSCAKYEHILIHAFSMGAYNFTLCMSEMYRAPELYSSIEKRIEAVVYDSLTIGTLKNMAHGVGMGLSKNRVLQTVIPLSMSLYFKLTNKYTVQVYEHFIDLFKQKPLQVPTLLFYCKNDPMSEYDVVEALVHDWKTKFSFSVVNKSWEKSKHSAHFLVHKDEYSKTLDNFLKGIPGLLKIESKI